MLQTADSFCDAGATVTHVQTGKTVMKNGSCDCYLEAPI